MEDRQDTPPMAWWASQRVRLAALLVCLGATIVLLLGTKTKLLSTGGSGGGRAEGASTWCVPRGLPAPASIDIEELRELRAGLLAVLAASGGRWHAEGVVRPEDMWSDDLPQRLRSSRLAHGIWPGGYEMRWWTRAYNMGADVLVFAGAPQARDFFEEAASTDCHRGGAQRRALAPPQALNLSWVNPDDAKQDDVFLLRGRFVYRVAAVRLRGAPAMTAQAERRTGAAFADTLACALPGAGCR
ncbi:MAG: hypothetical protein WB709_02040, partial [Solirubrobacteraceae bacterium]